MKFETNSAQFLGHLEPLPEMYEKEFREYMYRFLRYAHEEIMWRTPVHTGLTVRNYIVTMYRPEAGYYEAETTPQDKGQTGYAPKLGKEGMDLGPEPRRRANEREARRTRESVDLSNHPYKNIFITNNAPDAWKVEMGKVPEDPFVPRNWGMLQTTFSDLIGKVDDEFFR